MAGSVSVDLGMPLGLPRSAPVPVHCGISCSSNSGCYLACDSGSYEEKIKVKFLNFWDTQELYCKHS